ncbi:MAG: 4-hydroxybenzoyl-CoA reductase subunit beta [Gammaproteobacteria bacterium]|jgi:4-hydroxybenzoyl-CoA reductase subunit beta|nr:4-hydroxybenzoyl-CoA reductase subunit beta [Gammaproteobacteria bacterium]MCP4879884.1 4-hydroxybenzoyl-CoA reductase subunit beta [Gammaproteobacteria bacterium]MDP6165423.1 4-hydroxybenzoyl-CoA reductase subunit beta [Gammaproteobacteria bacterium]
MEILPEFELHQPDSVATAVKLGAQTGAKYLAGGTDLMPNLRHGLGDPISLIDVSGIADMQAIENTAMGLRIGASVTLQQLVTNPLVLANYSLLIEAANTIAGTTHRHHATVGGNLCLDTRCQYYNQSEWWRKSNSYCLKYKGDSCHVAPNGNVCRAAFSGDLAPAMLVHGAQVEIWSAKGGQRIIDLDDMYQDDGANSLLLKPGELLVAVLVKPLPTFNTGYRKVRVRGGLDFPLAGVAVAVQGRGNKLEQVMIALTGTDSRPILLKGCDDLCGKPLDDAALKALERLVRTQTKPMRSTFIPNQYRSKVAVNISRRLLLDLLMR